MSNGKDIENRIRGLMGERKARQSDQQKTIHNNNQVNIGNVPGHVGNVVVGDNNAIIINDTRRPDDRIDEDQQQEIRERLESLVKVDCLIGVARNPKDTRTLKQRHNSARRKRWHTLHSEFNVSSITRITQAQFEDVLEWLNEQKHAALDRLGPPARDGSKRKLSFIPPVRFMTLLLVVLAVPLMFSVRPTQRPPSTITGLIPAITVDKLPVIQPADALAPTGQLAVEPLQPYFEFHTGCTFFRAPRRVMPDQYMEGGKRHDI